MQPAVLHSSAKDVTTVPHTRRRWRTGTRAAWFIIAALGSLVLLASIPAAIQQLGTTTALELWRDTVTGIPVTRPDALELPLDLITWVVGLVSTAAYFALAVVLFVRKGDQPIALLFSLYLLIFGMVITGPLQTLTAAGTVWFRVGYISTTIVFQAFWFFFFVFPNGQFVPRWTRWLLIAFVFWIAGTLAFTDVVLPTRRVTLPHIALLFFWHLVLPLCGVAAQIYRYRRVSSPIERQQTKWVVLGFAAMFFVFLFLPLAYTFFLMNPSTANLSITIFGIRLFNLVYAAFLSLLPLTMGIAILRYRLWDLDFILNRALVYGSLSALIVGAYVLVVFSFGALFQTNERLIPVLVATALSVVLTRPLRARLQRGVDRLVRVNENHATVEPDPVHETRPVQSPRRWLPALRWGWMISAVAAVAFLLASTPAYVLTLGTITEQERAAIAMVGSLTLFSPSPAFEFWIDAAIAVVSFSASLLSLVLAVLIFRRLGNTVIGLLVSFTLLLYGIIMTGPAEFLLGYAANASMLGLMAQGFLWVPLIALFYVFPDGKFVPRWTRGLALALLPFGLGLGLLVPFAYSGVAERLLFPALALYTIFSLSAPLAQIYRYLRVSDATERQQIKWIAVGFTFWILTATLVPTLLLTLARSITSANAAGSVEWGWVALARMAWWVGLFALPLTLTIAILRYRLWEIDVLINRALVYGSLTALVVAIYILVVGGVGALFQTSGNLWVALLATALVALLFQPLRARVQRNVNRLLYGERDDPYAVIAQLGQRLEATLAPDAVLPTLVESVAQALKLPYVAVNLKEGDQFHRVAQMGEPGRPERDQPVPMATARLVSLPLVYQNELIGELVVAPRAGDETLAQADRLLLETIADQAALAAHAVRLTTDLQRSRERLVMTREEERRRIRRDLHDGLGPALASITLKLDAARNLLPPNAAASETLLKELKMQTQNAIADIRRLVYDLRPPALDELGLVGALREYAARSSSDELDIALHVTESLPTLPAAVEVAAYRIATEALTNVLRHAHARHCQVVLEFNGDLKLEISDDGAGLPKNFQAGVGLTSMRERAAELGGACVIEANDEHGTRVVAWLPIAKDKG